MGAGIADSGTRTGDPPGTPRRRAGPAAAPSGGGRGAHRTTFALTVIVAINVWGGTAGGHNTHHTRDGFIRVGQLGPRRWGGWLARLDFGLPHADCTSAPKPP